VRDKQKERLFEGQGKVEYFQVKIDEIYIMDRVALVSVFAASLLNLIKRSVVSAAVYCLL